MFNKKRLKIALVSGALLGIVCIAGVGLRMGFEGNELFLLATWYNRVIMGLVIGLAGGLTVIRGRFNPVVRGLLLGTMISLALFLSTELRDPLGFTAGIAYGPIIDVVASKYSKE
ncbi:MAG: hypothetical protein JW724_00875 [Candidatus Altiarchaeota archaeon]|nr:hypothetical protein [Candidatus Altiarchaeota archaeon]